MKNWTNPVIEAVDVKDTAHNWTGIYSDGGYIGDGIISGHLTWKKPEAAPSTPNPEPVNPVNPVEPIVEPVNTNS